MKREVKWFKEKDLYSDHLETLYLNSGHIQICKEKGEKEFWTIYEPENSCDEGHFVGESESLEELKKMVEEWV